VSNSKTQQILSDLKLLQVDSTTQVSFGKAETICGHWADRRTRKQFLTDLSGDDYQENILLLLVVFSENRKEEFSALMKSISKNAWKPHPALEIIVKSKNKALITEDLAYRAVHFAKKINLTDDLVRELLQGYEDVLSKISSSSKSLITTIKRFLLQYDFFQVLFSFFHVNLPPDLTEQEIKGFTSTENEPEPDVISSKQDEKSPRKETPVVKSPVVSPRKLESPKSPRKSVGLSDSILEGVVEVTLIELSFLNESDIVDASIKSASESEPEFEPVEISPTHDQESQQKESKSLITVNGPSLIETTAYSSGDEKSPRQETSMVMSPVLSPRSSRISGERPNSILEGIVEPKLIELSLSESGNVDASINSASESNPEFEPVEIKSKQDEKSPSKETPMVKSPALSPKSPRKSGGLSDSILEGVVKTKPIELSFINDQLPEPEELLEVSPILSIKSQVTVNRSSLFEATLELEIEPVEIRPIITDTRSSFPLDLTAVEQDKGEQLDVGELLGIQEEGEQNVTSPKEVEDKDQAHSSGSTFNFDDKEEINQVVDLEELVGLDALTPLSSKVGANQSVEPPWSDGETDHETLMTKKDLNDLAEFPLQDLNSPYLRNLEFKAGSPAKILVELGGQQPQIRKNLLVEEFATDNDPSQLTEYCLNNVGSEEEDEVLIPTDTKDTIDSDLVSPNFTESENEDDDEGYDESPEFSTESEDEDYKRDSLGMFG